MEEIPPELRDMPYKEAKVFQKMLAEREAEVPSGEIAEVPEEPIAPVEPVSGVAPPAAEMGAQEIPYYDTLGLKNLKRNNAYKALQQFDINNPAHAAPINTILDEIEKKGMPRDQAAINALRAKTEEVKLNASKIESAEPPNAGRGKQPEGGEEVGYTPVSGEGVRGGDQEGKGIAGEGEEKGPIIKEVRGAEIPSMPRLRKEQFDAKYNEHVRGDELVSAGFGYMRPDDFLKAVTSAQQEADIKRDLEVHGLPDFAQPGVINLIIDREGNIVGHEGRHRMMVLRDKGVKNVPVFIQRRSASEIPLQKRLSPQRNEGNYGRQDAFVYGLTPIHYNNRAELEEAYVERPQVKEAKLENPDKGIRPIKPEDYADIKNTRELAQRFKEKGTDPELLKLMSTINSSPHLGSIGIKWVKEGEEIHPEIAEAFRRGAAAMAAWEEGANPIIYFKANDPNLREDVIRSEEHTSELQSH